MPVLHLIDSVAVRFGRTRDVLPVNLNPLPPHNVSSPAGSIDSDDPLHGRLRTVITVLRASYRGHF